MINILNFFIKNRTPYVGNLKLKIEKYPHWTGQSLLNKVHLNLGFTTISTRMYPKNTKDLGWIVDPEKINLIEKYTGGYIRKYEWWDIYGVGTVYSKPDIGVKAFHSVLEDSFVSHDGKYIGDIKRGWWYYENRLAVGDKYQHAAKILDKNNNIIGYYGYSHRGGCRFKIGDKLFEASWRPNPNNYNKKKLDKILKGFNKTNEGMGSTENYSLADKIVEHISFKERGDITITTIEQAEQAAINLSNYLG